MLWEEERRERRNQCSIRRVSKERLNKEFESRGAGRNKERGSSIDYHDTYTKSGKGEGKIIKDVGGEEERKERPMRS